MTTFFSKVTRADNNCNVSVHILKTQRNSQESNDGAADVSQHNPRDELVNETAEGAGPANKDGGRTSHWHVNERSKNIESLKLTD